MIKTDKIKIVIFSGGTGAASLLLGLKNFDKSNKAMKITSIINAYDDGKSTGEVRKICNVLGPSDIRKNQWIRYEAIHLNNINCALKEFFNNRFNFSNVIDAKKNIKKILQLWELYDDKTIQLGFNEFFKCVDEYKDNINFNDINISNIIYAGLFKSIGYKNTIDYFNELLNLGDDDIILISEDNLKLNAITEKNIIYNEYNIVKWSNANDKIIDVFFTKFNSNDNEIVIPKLNSRAKDSILNADLIIFAPGTQWSSLIPTYKTENFYDIILSSKAKKILIMNNTEDFDNIGRTAGDLLNIINNYINLDNINIFINENSLHETLRNIDSWNKNSNIYFFDFGKNEKHDSKKLALEILKNYYNYQYTNIKFFDFDDTIYSRDPAHVEISELNLDLLNEISKFEDQRCIVVTGNDYNTIHKKLIKKYGLEKFNSSIFFDIFADGGIVKYKNGTVEMRDPNYLLDNVDDLIKYLNNLGIKKEKIFLRGDWPTQQYITCIGIKPLTELEKILLIELLNNYYFPLKKSNNIAKKIGLTGIDILHKDTNKILVFKYIDYDKNKDKTMYIGDDLLDGNDYEISKACDYSYNVKSPYDTNILLTIIIEDLNKRSKNK